MEVVCEEYRSSLSDLNNNSKPLINVLTMLAEENITYASNIVQVIETHLQKAPPEIKLPAIYLIDSIIKNVGGVYLTVFTQNIVSTFCSVFEKVDERTRMLLYKLRQTWTEIFPNKKLYAIDVRVKQIDPAWPITADVPAQHSIHVNPKFLGGNQKPPTTTTTTDLVKDSKESSKDQEKQQAEVLKQLLFKRQELLRLQKQKLELDVIQNSKTKSSFQLHDKQRSSPPVHGFLMSKKNHSCPTLSEIQCQENPPQDMRSQIPAQVFRSHLTPQGLRSQMSQPPLLSHPIIEYQSCPQRAMLPPPAVVPVAPISADPRLQRIEGRLSQRDPRIQKVGISSSNSGQPEFTKSTKEPVTVGSTSESVPLNAEIVANTQQEKTENVASVNIPKSPKKSSSNVAHESNVSNLVPVNSFVKSKSNNQEISSSLQIEKHNSSKLLPEEKSSKKPFIKTNKSTNDKNSSPCGNLSTSENKKITVESKISLKSKVEESVQKSSCDNRIKEDKAKQDKPREGALIVRLRPDPCNKEESKPKTLNKEANEIQDLSKNEPICKENKIKEICALKETNNNTSISEQDKKLKNNTKDVDMEYVAQSKENNIVVDIKQKDFIKNKDISQKEENQSKEDVKRKENTKSKEDINQKKDNKINEEARQNVDNESKKEICQREKQNKGDIGQKEEVTIPEDNRSKEDIRNEEKKNKENFKERKVRSKESGICKDASPVKSDTDNSKTKENVGKYKKSNDKDSKSKSPTKNQRSRVATFSNKASESESKKEKRSPRKNKDLAVNNIGMRLRSTSPSKFQARVTRSQTRNRAEESGEEKNVKRDESSLLTATKKKSKDCKRKDSSLKSAPSSKRNCLTALDETTKDQINTAQPEVMLEPIKDTDLRIMQQPSTSSNGEQISRQEKNKATKRELNDEPSMETNKDDDFKENDKEPPVKKIKEEETTDSLFSGEDQDYRQLSMDPSPRSTNHKGWAQYKAAHEFRSPLRQSLENNENSDEFERQVLEDQDFRHRRGHHSRENYQPNDPRNWGFDRLGRPLLSRLSLNRFGYENDPGPEQKQTKASLMLSKQKEIIQHAQEQLHLGIMSPEQYNDLSNELQILKEQQFKRPYAHRGFEKHFYKGRKIPFQQNFGSEGDYRNHMSERKPLTADIGRSHLPLPNSVTSIKVDNKLRKILFVEERCIIIMDNDEPREITFNGEPVPVFIDEMDPIILSFDGDRKHFEINGRSHSIKLGTPSREVYVDGYPYEAKFGGPSFVVFLVGKAHSIRLGGPAPRVHISEETSDELKKLMSLNMTDESLSCAKPLLPNPKGKSRDIDLRTHSFHASKKTNDLDLRHVDENINRGQDIDMRWNKGRVPSQEPFDELNLEHFEVKPEPHSSMKDVDYRPSRTFPQDKDVSEGSNMIPTSTSLASAVVSGSESSILSQMEEFRVPPDGELLPHPPHWIQHRATEDFPNEERKPNRPFLHPKTEWEEKENQMDWEYDDLKYSKFSPTYSPTYSPPMFRRKDQDKLPLMHSQDSQREDRSSQSYYPTMNVQERSQVQIPGNEWTESGNRNYEEQDMRWDSDRNPQNWDWGDNAQAGNRHSPLLIPDPGQEMYKLRKSGHPPQEDFNSYHVTEGHGRPLPMQSVAGHRPQRPPMYGSSRRQGSLQPRINQRPRMPMFRPWYGAPGHERDPRMNFLPRRGFGPYPRMEMRPPLLPVRPGNSLLPFPVAPPSEPPPAVLPVPSTSSPLLATPVAPTSSDITVVLPSTTENQPIEPLASLPETANLLQPSTTIDINALFEKLLAKGLINQQVTELEENKPEKDSNAKEEEEEVEEKEKKKIKDLPVIEFTAESLKVHHPKVIEALHQGTQCASCGMRFKEQNMDRYSQHLDWHFRVNRREKDGVKKAFSRKWFYDVEDWIQFEEFEDLEERARSFFELQANEEQYQVPVPVEVPSVPALSQETEICVMCSEPFQLFWVEEEEEWHLRDAVRHEGQAYHPLCLEDFKKATETPDTSIETIPPDAIKEEVIDNEIKKEEGQDEQLEEEESKPNEVEMKAEDSESQVVDKTSVSNIVDTKTELADEVKEEEEEEEIKMDGKPGEEEIIGLITEDTPMEPVEPRPESKMVVLQSSGSIVMKVKAESIAQPSSPSPASQEDNTEVTNSLEEEIEFRPPTPDPRFQVLPPVQIGKELSGLCCLM